MVDMKFLFPILFVMAVVSVQAQNSVRLKGKLVGMGTDLVKLSYDGATSVIGDEGSFMIRTDREGHFDTILPLSKPAFYRISRNTLYLSKGGSFLGELRNRKGSFEEIKVAVDSLAQLRMAELERVKEATPAFKELEKARIVADMANSYTAYPSYCALQPVRSREEREKFMQQIIPDLLKVVPRVNREEYLDVAVVRDVIGTAMETPGLKEKLQFPERTQELFTAAQYAYKLDSEINTELVGEVREYAGKLKNTDIREVLEVKLNSAGALLKGSPAVDLELLAPDGKTARLSDYKGKVIYVDLWATWCGPCIQESPKFHELAKKYRNDNIVFLAVSTDTEKKSWLSFIEGKEAGIPEYNCTDTKNLNEGWQIKYIPRFLLIDENFKIIDAYAPRPSQPEAVELLDKILKK